VAREGFVIEGWAFDQDRGPFVGVEVFHGADDVGSTTLRHRRPDVRMALANVTDEFCGFRVPVSLAGVPGGLKALEIRVAFASGEPWTCGREIVVGPNDYRSAPYGALASADDDRLRRREDIYGSGPPSPVASADCAALLTSYLVPGERVLDVGCGIGAYGRILRPAGIDWHGCEVRPEFIRVMNDFDLPATLLEGPGLPFADDAFESALCIEVLEHVAEPAPFLAEIARVARRRTFFSVPNATAIPVLADQSVVPWHLLEADHKHFFTAASLRATLERHFRHVEVIPYSTMPMRSSNGSAIYYHFFAVAEH